MKLHETASRPSQVRGVKIYEIRHVRDEVRGNLSVVNFEEVLPFVPRRCFITYQIPSGQTRGEHAHRICGQFMLCVSGSCRLTLDDGQVQEEIWLNRPTVGVYVPPGVWAAEDQHSADSALMVFASHPYDPSDYIRAYDEFLALVGAQPILPACT